MAEAGKKVWLILISSLLFGSSLSLIVSKFLIEKFGINFISLDMPGVSEKLAYEKTFDLLDFGFAGILSLIFFSVNYYGAKFFSKKNSEFGIITLFIFSVTTFIQSHFLLYSATQVLILTLVFELLFFAFLKFEKYFDISLFWNFLNSDEGKVRFQNGVLIGFVLVLLCNLLTTIPALSMALLILTPLLLTSLTLKKAQNFLENFPGFLMPLAILFPINLLMLFGLLIFSSVTAVLISKYKPGFFIKNIFVNILNPAIIIFVLVYNPSFNIGNFDSVEEGFWLAWVERLINGQILYRDAAVYHPPLIPWGMYLFSNFFGFNLYSERLFLHLLQISGFIIFFFFAKKVIENSVFAALALFIFLAITSSLVRNNIEIRLGLPLLSLIFFFNYLSSKNLKQLFISGLIAIASLLLSIESGLTVILTILVSLNVFSETKFLSSARLKENLYFIAGVLIPFTVFVIYLLATGSFNAFFEQTFFYAKAFSSGYFNTPVDRTVMRNYFYFDPFDEYFDSVWIFWELTKLTFYGFIIFGFYKFFSDKKFTVENSIILTTAFFGLVLTRAALGRSDWYHLLFVLGVVIVLIYYALSKLYETQKLLTLGLILFMVFVMARPSINNSFLNDLLYKYQTYGRVFGEYNAYYFDRGTGALVEPETETKPVFEMVEYVQLNSSPDDKIFVFPWNPEIYFYADRKNATRIDTPYAFFSEKYQDEVINDLKSNKPKFVIYNENMNFGGLSTGAVDKVNQFVRSQFTTVSTFGPFQIMTPDY